eukprot:CAMPEP_0113308440 /NCGR_PEP_ID=MMETSP0010_2-20120614/6881_1 /TAXON_ID=216773 ORGANISM="Corethron hystrix, Strain 308" /NCGR_SAMPLE_ID=MMETSP0010_2 /ASSEMBLY_ACC=CAM_ASM_000155 /LENGTH=456 /DNA_ID=CAMNT_0000163489 /DNA_START=164 /DNA_END=1531 /DNA_ORIENTATION=+ /assembly_acc=CAM_ASM_000155
MSNQNRSDTESLNDDRNDIFDDFVGIKNLGATCYASSSIQLVLHAILSGEESQEFLNCTPPIHKRDIEAKHLIKKESCGNDQRDRDYEELVCQSFTKPTTDDLIFDLQHGNKSLLDDSNPSSTVGYQLNKIESNATIQPMTRFISQWYLLRHQAFLLPRLKNLNKQNLVLDPATFLHSFYGTTESENVWNPHEERDAFEFFSALLDKLISENGSESIKMTCEGRSLQSLIEMSEMTSGSDKMLSKSSNSDDNHNLDSFNSGIIDSNQLSCDDLNSNENENNEIANIDNGRKIFKATKCRHWEKPLRIISLPVPSGSNSNQPDGATSKYVTLEDCFRAYTAPEVVQYNWYDNNSSKPCSECKNMYWENSKKTTLNNSSSLQRKCRLEESKYFVNPDTANFTVRRTELRSKNLPPKLIIHLKRFKWDRSQNSGHVHKIKKKVIIPEVLDLSEEKGQNW